MEMKIVKKISYYITFLIFFIVCFSCKNNAGSKLENMSQNSDELSDAEDFAVDVNGFKLTETEVETELTRRLGGMAAKLPQEQLAEIKTQMRGEVIENFLIYKLLTEEAEKQEISVSDQEIDLALNEITQKMPPGMSSEEALKSKGMNIENIREKIESELKLSKLIEKQTHEDMAVSEEELQEYYNVNKAEFVTPENVNARHILVKVKPDEQEKDNKEKLAKIESLREELLKGADFADIAQKNSDCPSKKDGGNIGTFSRGSMVKTFEDSAFSQKINEIGPIIETDFGYHIVQVLARNEAKTQSYEEVKGVIEKRVKEQKTQEDIRNYILSLKEKATIVYGKNDSKE